MDIVKAINLGDYQMLVQLEVSGPKLGFSSVIKIDAGFSTDNSQSDGYEEIDIPAKVDIEKHKGLVDKKLEEMLDDEIQQKHVGKGKGTDINFRITKDGITPLMLACTTGYIDIVKMLIVNPLLNMNQEDSAGINAIYVAGYYGQLEILQLLMDYGGIAKPSHKGTSILHVACKRGYFDVVKFLLKDSPQRIPIDGRKANGYTPVMLAC
jgi:ankyrin repeat protein